MSCPSVWRLAVKSPLVYIWSNSRRTIGKAEFFCSCVAVVTNSTPRQVSGILRFQCFQIIFICGDGAVYHPSASKPQMIRWFNIEFIFSDLFIPILSFVIWSFWRSTGLPGNLLRAAWKWYKVLSASISQSTQGVPSVSPLNTSALAVVKNG